MKSSDTVEGLMMLFRLGKGGIGYGDPNCKISEVSLSRATVLVTLIAFVVASRFSLKSYNIFPRKQRLFTAEELALYNGTDDSLPILLGILGSVFDVTKGKSHYGVGGGYNHFAGRDASRAFVSGNFTGDGLTDSLRGLSSTEVKSIVGWRDFYFRSYTFVGTLFGRYYDSQGNPTKTLKGAKQKQQEVHSFWRNRKLKKQNNPVAVQGGVKMREERYGVTMGFKISSETSRNRVDWEDEQAMRLLSRRSTEPARIRGVPRL